MNDNKFQNTYTIAILAFICCFLWGSAIPIIKKGYSILQIDAEDMASQLVFAGARFTLAGIMIILFGSILFRGQMKPNPRLWKLSVILSIFQTIGQYAFFYIGAAHTSGVKGTIIVGLNNFCAILVACLVFRQEKLTQQKLLGCMIGLCGILIINILGNQVDLGFHMAGEGCYLLSTISYSFSTVLISRFSKQEYAVALSGYQFTIGGIVLFLAGRGFGGVIPSITYQSLILLLYLAFVSAVAYTLWSILLAHNPVSRVAVFGFMNPLCGVILSALILKEMDRLQGFFPILALLLVCIGIFVVNKSEEAS